MSLNLFVCSLLLPIVLTQVHQQPPPVQGQPPIQQTQPPRTQSVRKFEYKHSFKGPNLSQKDNSIPFWEVTGDAIASSEQLRLAPSIRSKKGIAWNSRPFTDAEFFDIEIALRVTGQGRIGADGLAFWYTAQKGTLGPVFGSNNYWIGLGVFFDSFDNDAQRNNPYIMGMVNDGTKAYDHQNDGSTQKLAGCHKDFRNRPFPVKIKVEYFRNVLTVLVHDGMTQNERYELCLRSENVFLPRNGFFGLTAATGGLADDHDIISFMVSSLRPPEAVNPPAIKIPESEQKKYEEEFEKYWQEFETEKDKFQKEHPDKVKSADPDFAKLYEDAAERELRLIYEGQNVMHNVMNQIDGKLNNLIQQAQQNSMMITSLSQGQPVQQQQGQQQPQQQIGQQPVDTFKRHEVNEVMQLSREMHASVRDMKQYVNDIYTKTSNLEQRVQAGVGSVQPAGGGSQHGGQYDFNAVKTYLEGIKHDVEQLRINSGPGGGGNSRSQLSCPEPSCLNATLFFVVIAVQSVVFIMYSMLKGGQEKAKFY